MKRKVKTLINWFVSWRMRWERRTSCFFGAVIGIATVIIKFEQMGMFSILIGFLAFGGAIIILPIIIFIIEKLMGYED